MTLLKMVVTTLDVRTEVKVDGFREIARGPYEKTGDGVFIFIIIFQRD